MLKSMIQKLLRPKNATFCPGCVSSLKLKKEFIYDIKEPETNISNNSNDTKVISLKDAIKKKTGKQVASLF